MNAREESKIAAGEVETPCATCGGSGVDDQIPEQGRYSGGRFVDDDVPCPDCGVETPEAAVEAIAKALHAHVVAKVVGLTFIECKSQARAALDEARAQGWTPPRGTE